MLKNFKLLGQINVNSVGKCVCVFFKFVISVRGGGCGYSLWVPKKKKVVTSLPVKTEINLICTWWFTSYWAFLTYGTW